jgi:hypothetical protein
MTPLLLLEPDAQRQGGKMERLLHDVLALKRLASDPDHQLVCQRDVAKPRHEIDIFPFSGLPVHCMGSEHFHV